MEWTDQGVVLAARPHGESAAVVTLMTREHGRHAGLVQGGQSARRRPDLEPGTQVEARWRTRMAEGLGNYTLEAERHHAAAVLGDPLRLAALVAACSLIEAGMPEREPHPGVYNGMLALFDALQTDVWDAAYVAWEVGLLRELGFGLELACCAVTGTNDMLAYVSPRTGRAVSLSAGEDYRDRLLPLPGFLIGRGMAGREEIRQGLELTAYFIERHALASRDVPLPAARIRLAERYRREAIQSGMETA